MLQLWKIRKEFSFWVYKYDNGSNYNSYQERYVATLNNKVRKRISNDENNREIYEVGSAHKE